MIRFPVAALTISVCLVVLLLSVAEASELLPCPSGKKYFKWHWCFGTHTFVNGDKKGAKYVGEWKRGKFHGKGALLEPDGSSFVGVWKDNKFIEGKKTKKQTERKHGKTKQPTCPEDKLEKLKCLAKNWNTDAQFKLGSMYEKGEGVPRDYKTAVKWYHKAADQGNADAQFKLGSMYEKGEGVRQSDRSAKYWYKRAVKQYTRAAEQGNTDAQFKLAVMYEVGMGVPKNYETSAKWYTHHAAEQGDADAQLELGVMYEKGWGVPKDYKAAVKWYTRAAEQGDADAKILVDIARKKLEEQERIHKEKADIARKKLEEQERIHKEKADFLREEREQIAEEVRIAEEKRKQERQCKGDDESKWQNCEGTLAAQSRKYVGVFKDGIFDGKNTEDDVKYIGEYKDGTLNGQGRKISGANGWTYVGEFRDGKYHGQGTFTFADGGKYVGEYRDDKRNGEGTMTYTYGAKYVGEWRDDKRNGEGTMTQAYGTEYVGEYRDDKRNGEGTYTFADGRVWQGTFANDAFVSGDKSTKSQRFEAANDDIRLALDILNYTLKGDKQSKDGAKASSSQECIFYVFNASGKQTLYVDNIVSDTVQFHSKRNYNEAWQQWQERYYVKFSGDERVWNDKLSGKIFLHRDASLERVQKAWGMLFSKACEGASPSEF